MEETTNRHIVMLAMMVATFLAAIEGTIVSTAMPTIVGELHGIKLMNWVFSVYLLLSSVTVPIFGKLADLFGRKKIFIFGTMIFLIGSTLCGLSQSMGQLIAFRLVQGIGAGALLPVTTTIVADIYPYEQRAKMLGFISLVWGISGVIGPLVGGFFVDQLSWHWIFFMNIPFGLITVVMVIFAFKEKVAKRKKSIDYIGALTFFIGAFALLYAFQRAGEENEWTSPVILSLFAVAVLFIAGFLILETKASDPMIPLSLFRLRAISVANTIAFFISAALMGINVYMPMWIQGVLGYDATTSGLTLAPMSVLWTVGSFLCGKLLVQKGARFTTLVGAGLLLIGAMSLVAINAATPLTVLYAIGAVLGIAFGLVVASTTVTVQSAVDWSKRGVATASNTFFRNLGQTIGVAVLGTYFNARITANLMQHKGAKGIGIEHMNQLINPHFAKSLAPDIRDVLRHVLAFGIHNVFIAMVVLTFIALVVTFRIPGGKQVAESETNR